MSLTPGGNPVCVKCDRSLCVCCPEEQRIIADALAVLGIANNVTVAVGIAGELLNALNEAGYEVVDKW